MRSEPKHANDQLPVARAPDIPAQGLAGSCTKTPEPPHPLRKRNIGCGSFRAPTRACGNEASAAGVPARQQGAWCMYRKTRLGTSCSDTTRRHGACTISTKAGRHLAVCRTNSRGTCPKGKDPCTDTLQQGYMYQHTRTRNASPPTAQTPVQTNRFAPVTAEGPPCEA